MKNERQIEELAKIAMPYGFTGYGRDYPDYLSSHDALQPIINGLFDSAQQAYDYHDKITEICSDDYLYVHTATPAQKAEAILRAVGRWEET